MQTINSLERRVAELESGLMKMACGTVAIPNVSKMWYIHPKGRIYSRDYKCNLHDRRTHYADDGGIVSVGVSDCFSTRELAAAAAKEK